MPSFSNTESLSETVSSPSFSARLIIKWLVLGGISLVNGYVSILMYAQGEFAFAILTVVLTALAVAIFGSKKTYAHRYIYPGIAGMILFVVFPLVYTVGLALTNYSAKNQLSFERAQSVLLGQTFQSGENYPFQLHSSENGFRIFINQSGKWAVSPVIEFDNITSTTIPMSSVANPIGSKEKMKTVIKHRKTLSTLSLALPNGDEVTMNGLRKFGSVRPKYHLLEDRRTLVNQETQQIFKPNDDIGYYQAFSNGKFQGDPISPGYVVNIGTDNFERVWKDEGIKEPFINIFIWTIVFSVCTVVFTLFIGLILASVVQWEALRGRAVYRVMLILPYAVPSFISILIFKGLFNQSFGEINMVLNALFGISPTWFSDPILAKTMVLVVNTWLGFPYMMILCMGLLKAIPNDLYEASAIDGAGPIKNFVHITLPLMMRPLTPLLIATFAFNFNNFVMIMLLTEGGPNRIGTSEPAGYTDLLVSYTYRIAFEGSGGQDFGLASAIATLIFLLVGGLALLNLKFTKLSER
ncbi:maltose ABC transporter permease MalF [Vibrio penaeicida]|uniref:Maltose/maltodextrin transport system permease protein n=1 Tax=Vibrio penaeicida TaxID=104609 RepID=A0AAV5NYY0_9VIBR|nr:maltose ABC transporter permease MalF [Vibrio penaeicida]RTZ21624.1 maltose ABC transporter permease MalF [Vibrio penaeicida]GLQ75775.1 maltose transport system permease protein MalF [Vibrio penaeicida]